MNVDENIFAYTMFKVDLLTNSLPPKVYNVFFVNNKKGKRLKELDDWRKEYIKKETNKVPKEIRVYKKEVSRDE